MAGTLRYKRLELGEYSIPDEAIKLIEDIQTLDRILDQLGTLDPLTLHSNQEQGWQAKRRLITVLTTWRSYARETLRWNYLGGRKITPRPKPQTLADIWRIFTSENMGKNDGKKTVEKKNFREF